MCGLCGHQLTPSMLFDSPSPLQQLPRHQPTPSSRSPLFFCEQCLKYISARRVLQSRNFAGRIEYACPTCHTTLRVERFRASGILVVVSFILLFAAFTLQQPRLFSPLTLHPGELFFIQEQGQGAVLQYYYQSISDSTFHVLLRISIGGSFLIDCEIINQQFQLLDRVFTIDAYNSLTGEVTLSWE